MFEKKKHWEYTNFQTHPNIKSSIHGKFPTYSSIFAKLLLSLPPHGPPKELDPILKPWASEAVFNIKGMGLITFAV